MFDQKQKKWLIIGLVLLVMLGIAGFVKSSIDNMYFQPHGYIEIVSVPDELSYSYQDKTKSIKSGDVKPVPVGDYDIMFRSEGFSDKTMPVSVVNGETVALGVQLEPESTEAFDEFTSSKYDRQKEFTTAYRMDEETKKIEEKNPIIAKLPILSENYTAEQCEPYRKETIDRGNIGICVQILNPEKYKEVIKELSSDDTDLDKYDILFNNDYTYPNKADRKAGKAFTLIEPVDYGHGEE